MIFKTLVFGEWKKGYKLFDTIEYRGGFWLVPGWIETRRQGWLAPVRLIRLSRPIQFEDVGANNPGHQFLVNVPLPKQLFDPTVPMQLREKYEILDEPDLEFEHRPDPS